MVAVAGLCLTLIVVGYGLRFLVRLFVGWFVLWVFWMLDLRFCFVIFVWLFSDCWLYLLLRVWVTCFDFDLAYLFLVVCLMVVFSILLVFFLVVRLVFNSVVC